MSAVPFVCVIMIGILSSSCITGRPKSEAQTQDLGGIRISLRGYIRSHAEQWHPGASGEGWHATIRLQNTSNSNIECLVASVPENYPDDFSKTSLLSDRESIELPNKLIWKKSDLKQVPELLWALKRYGLSNVRTEILDPGGSVEILLPIFELQGGTQSITNRFILEHRVPGSWPYLTYAASLTGINRD